MSPKRIVLYALVTVLAAPSTALAQDDLLAPLTPQTKPSRKPAKPKVTKKKKAAPTAKKPTRGTKPAVSKGKGKGKKQQQAAPPEEDLLAPLAPPKTELMARIANSVRGATLVVDGKEVGVLTAAPVPLELPPGEHSVLVRKPGYAEYSRSINLKEGEQTELVVTLEATKGFGKLTADVPGAVVSVDDQELGTVPRSVLLEPGSREIVFRAPGFKPDVHNITVFAGKPYEVAGKLRPLVDTSVASTDTPTNPDLTPGVTPDAQPDPLAEPPKVAEVSTSKPWYGRWYVWAGVGAVVAAGTGAYLATQGTPDPLSATDVCGRECDGEINGTSKVRGGAIQLPSRAFSF